MYLIALLISCNPFSNGEDDTGHECGPGTHWDGEYCAPDVDTDNPEGDADTDADTDSDTDSDADTDSDTDSDTDPVDDYDGDGFTVEDGDCDDGDASVHPGAEEVCDNGVDDNCDGSTNGCGWGGEYLLPDVGIKLSGARSQDSTGRAIALGGDSNGDGSPEILVGAPYRDDGAQSTGAVYLLNGPITADASLDDGMAVLLGADEEDLVGWDIAFMGDTDGDGYDDFAVSKLGTQETSSGRYDGAVYVIHGPVSGTHQIADLGETWTAATQWEGSGETLSAVGDVTGDGTPDLLVGARNDSSYSNYAGAAWILNGPASGGGSFSSADVRIYGTSSSYMFGSSVSGLGDVNGDGVADFAASSPGYYRSGTGYVGRLSVFFGPVAGALLDTDADAAVYGTSSTGYLGYEGYALGEAGDIDGDGYDDLLVVHPEEHDGSNTYAGAIYIVGGDGLTGDVELLLADGKLLGSSSGVMLGLYGGAGVGDIDLDGQDDLLVGASQTSDHGSNSGTAYLVTGPIAGTSYVSDAARATFCGDGSSVKAGAALAGGVDITGDGMLDLLVGARGDDGDASDAGAVYIVPGLGF